MNLTSLPGARRPALSLTTPGCFAPLALVLALLLPGLGTAAPEASLPLVLAHHGWDEGDDPEDFDGGAGTTGHEHQGQTLQGQGAGAVQSFGMPGADLSEGRGDEDLSSGEESEVFENVAPQAEKLLQPSKSRPVRARSSLKPPPAPSLGLMPIRQKRKRFARLGKEILQGYSALPEGALPGNPGIVLVHDYWGLRSWTEERADALARLGYRVLAVDLYRGRVAGDRTRALALQAKLREQKNRGAAVVAKAVRYLRDQGAGSVGVLGWSLGATVALRSALRYPQGVDALVLYYGSLKLPLERLERLGAPLLGIYAGKDRAVPLARVRAVQERLRALEKTHVIQVYSKADHAFANPPVGEEGDRYRAGDAEDAWERTLEFLKLHLIEEE